jgi:hypothetical protein
MINLNNVTFIIPIKLESKDRELNLEIVLKYLNSHFNTNIIVYESDSSSKGEYICKGYENVKYFYINDNSSVFHKTKLLNEMLNMVETEVVVNYDTDVILPVESYVTCSNLILCGMYDLIYPYFLGYSQKRVYYEGRDIISKTLDVKTIPNTSIESWNSVCGHCQFFNTNVYKDGGMMNEYFMSYGPEDAEIMYRFKKLGYKVHWHNSFVYHLEHTRTHNSNESNTFFNQNCNIFEKIKSLSVEELKDYYKNVEYIKKYI